MRCSGSLCSNTKVMHRPETASPELQKKRAALASTSTSSNNIDASSRSMKAPLPLHELNGAVTATNSSLSVSSATASASSSAGGSFRGMPFRRFSGCYECRMVVDPVLGIARDPSLRTSICSCPDCGEIFMKPENLELHQAVRHAVSELGPEDTSKNIVEIIFQSSWLKKQTPICQIDRILKVHNTQRTISKFEEYRDSIKSKANKLPKKHPRCIADGNELLRFHCTTFACSLGLNGSSNLCNSIPNCNVCSIIKNGFKVAQGQESSSGKGILTTATSGKAHDKAAGVVEEINGNNNQNEKRAMLVCRVIAGRVKKSMEGSMEDYDSVAGAVGVYSNLDELYVFNPKAILPCFVVIYRGF
ncbi:putative nucleic acid binding protein [Corchorus olitorius]|uniref:Nucleic acid binding protein n=1 Tax=Corchorus olitorius TaxID=93759 RepID=A0A1R3FVH6_9ROSI|nr:putative nucleic acid binding protein [Corchorus olitorius]